jgi:hypothetical protein
MSTIEKSLKFAAMRTQINKLHQTIRDVETPPAKASKNTSELGMPSTTAIRLSGRHNVRTARNGPNLDGATVGRSDSIEENDLRRALAESRQADDVTKEDEATPLSIRGGGDSDMESADDQTNIRHYSGSDNPYNSEYNQADEVASDEAERVWEENFRRECSEAERLEEARERLRQLWPHTEWSQQEVGVGNWQGAEEEDDDTAGEREEDQDSDEDGSQWSTWSDEPDGMVVALRPGQGQMLAIPQPNEVRSAQTSPTNINDPNNSSGWGRPRPAFCDLLLDQNAEVDGRNVEVGLPGIPPPLVNHRLIFLGGNLGEPTTTSSPTEIEVDSRNVEVDMSSGWGRPRPNFVNFLPVHNAEVDGRNVEVGVPAIPPSYQVQPVVGNHSSPRIFLGGNLGEPTTVPSPMEVNATCSPVEAKASTASNEAQNGSPPPNSGSAAPSSPVARSSQAEDGSGVVQES